MNLTNYLNHWSQQDYQEGEHDCGLFIARWVDLNLGTKFSQQIQGSYRTVNEGLRKHAPKGIGKRALIELEKRGCKISSTPQPGAIAVLENGFCAIWDGEWCVGPILGLSGYCCIHRRHATHFIILSNLQDHA